MTRRASKALLVLAVFVCGLFTLSAFADSQVRIVRLSDLDGDVQIDHGTGYEKALRNMPITQGVKLWTKDGGLAEVEFEDGSAVRLTPNTRVEFPALSLRDSGAKVSTVEVKEGTAYFTINKQKNDDFTVAFGSQHATIKDAVRFRINLDHNQAKLAVMKGNLLLQGPSGEVKLAKGHTLNVDLSGSENYEIAKGVQSDQYDNWNKQESQYQSQYNYANAANSSWPYSYGLSDLNYYGNYFYQPGWGWLWQPYFVGANWNPFMNGAWAWYPGIGYTFVSTYPWGWMPYRYGNWAFIPGWGWCWQPGGFVSWNPVPTVVNPPAGFRTPAPPVTTVASHPTVPIRPARNPRLPMSMREDTFQGGRPGRVVTSIPVHGGGISSARSPAIAGPHGASLGPRGTIARPPAMSSPRMSAPRSGGFGGFGSTGRIGTSAGNAGSSRGSSSTPHH